ncbi:MAG: FkbM family methyltransferase [Bryobacterales bacterium]|nr:FkbM family methyltransferase [Bryobacterales bacterium]
METPFVLDISRVPIQSWVGRLLRGALGLMPKRAAVAVLQGPLRGARWIVGSATHGCWMGTYELTKQKLFAGLITPGTVVFDIGANVGFYTLLAARVTGPSGRVYAFEPLPRNVAFLREHLRMNRVGNVELVESAVSNFDGEGMFFADTDPHMGHLSLSGKFKVPVLQLSNFVEQHGASAPHLIKIDVEGAEAEVLDGAEALLRRYRPRILLATHSRPVHAECCARLRALGYALESITDQPVAQTDELLATAL